MYETQGCNRIVVPAEYKVRVSRVDEGGKKFKRQLDEASSGTKTMPIVGVE